MPARTCGRLASPLRYRAWEAPSPITDETNAMAARSSQKLITGTQGHSEPTSRTSIAESSREKGTREEVTGAQLLFRSWRKRTS